MCITYVEREFQDPKGFWTYDTGCWMLEEDAAKLPKGPFVGPDKTVKTVQRVFRYLIGGYK